MSGRAFETVDTVRAAEVVAAACLATDLGMGLPFEHGLHATLMAMRLADVLEVDRETASQTYFCSLLMYSGCTTDADVLLGIIGGSATESGASTMFGSPLQALTGIARAVPSPDAPPHRRAYEVVTRLPRFVSIARPHTRAVCEVATMLAKRLGLPRSIHDLFTVLTERWDGYGIIRRARGQQIPLALRIVHVARDAAYQRVVGGDAHAAAIITRSSRSVPTLLLWGDHDPFGDAAVARATARAIPDAHLELLPAGHGPWLGHPDRVAELVSEFVRR